MRIKPLAALTVATCAIAIGMLSPTTARAADIDCKLTYKLDGWSFIYKQTSGKGTVTCDNGQSIPVHVSAKAVGLTAGKWQIDNGKGRFTDVHSINDVLGRYVQASANAGIVKSGEAQVLTKGPVSLALAGGGEGINLGVDVGAFKIERGR